MAEYEILTRGQDDGVQVCTAATQKVGFFGATPVVQQTATTAVTAGSTTTVCNEAVASIQTALENLGLMA